MTQSERNEQIVSLRSEGVTLEEISKQFGITTQRVSKIIKNHKGEVTHYVALSVETKLKLDELSSIYDRTPPSMVKQLINKSLLSAKRRINRYEKPE